MTVPIKTSCTVSFNPNELHFSQSAEYDSGKVPGDDIYSIQFTKMQVKECSFKLFFDTFMNAKLPIVGAYKNVKELTDKFVALIDIDKEKGSPPKIQFIWGSFEVTGYVKSITENYTMFSSEGVPVRAELDISMIVAEEKLYMNAKSDDNDEANGRPGLG